MLNIAYYTYILAGLGFFGLLLLLLTTGVKTFNSKLLFGAVLTTALWCSSVGIAGIYSQPIIFTFIGEIAKNLLWGTLCVNLLLKESTFSRLVFRLHQFSWFHLAVIISAIVLSLSINSLLEDIYWLFMSFLVIAIAHLIMVEFLYRQGSSDFKWGFKPLALAISAYAIVDLTLYSSSILTAQLNQELYWFRGAIYLLLIPLLVIGIKRQKSLGVRLFISREVVFHSTLLLGISIYLIAMSIVGYYLKVIGGQWGIVSQVIFIILALVLLFFLFISETSRSKLRVFISKHFFANRYDYRQQWLKLNANLAANKYRDYNETALFALMDLFAIEQGALYVVTEHQHLKLTSTINISTDISQWVPFLNNYQHNDKQWIIDLDEFERFPEVYPNAIDGIKPMLEQPMRLIVPIHSQGKLFGYFLLSRPGHHHIVNYEDRDLLSTASEQLANFLALHKANQAILEASQFDAFNRMSAFLVHDLKNVVAQLSLVSSNCVHHKDNPEFIDDTFDTIENSVTKMNKMLAQLRSKQNSDKEDRSASLRDIFDDVGKQSQEVRPIPSLSCESEVILYLNPERLTNIILHLVQNSQQHVKKTIALTLAIRAQ